MHDHVIHLHVCLVDVADLQILMRCRRAVCSHTEMHNVFVAPSLSLQQSKIATRFPLSSCFPDVI